MDDRGTPLQLLRVTTAYEPVFQHMAHPVLPTAALF